jgi:PAS domain S-box-containing protein
MTLGRGEGLAGAVWTTGKPVWIADARRSSPLLPLPAYVEGMRGACAVPIAIGEVPIGAMEFFSVEIRPPGEDLLTEWFGGVGALVGQFIETRRAEQALRESEERLRLATQAGSIGIWEWDIPANHVIWTDAIYSIHGIRKEDFNPTVEGFAALVHPADREMVAQSIDRALRGDVPYELAFRALKPGGEAVWIFTSATVIRSGGKPVRMIGASANITPLKQAEEELLRWEHDLESRVEERTRQLAMALEQLRAESVERERLEAEITRIVEREQQRLGQELHDGIGQELTGLKFILSALHVDAKKEAPGLAEKLTNIEGLISRTIAHTRGLAKSFYPVGAQQLGLVAALDDVVVRARALGVACVVQSDSPGQKFQGPYAIQLFRIAQEAVINAAKHSKAKKVRVRLAESDGHVELTVEDEGVGLPENFEQNGGMGMHIMRYRARAIGGQLIVRNGSGGGVVVTCTAPRASPS